MIRGGVGTVAAMVIEQPMLIAHAINSTVNLKGWEFQSSRIQSIVGLKIVCIIILVIKKARAMPGFLTSN
jgi:hypothetical protein